MVITIDIYKCNGFMEYFMKYEREYFNEKYVKVRNRFSTHLNDGW